MTSKNLPSLRDSSAFDETVQNVTRISDPVSPSLLLFQLNDVLTPSPLHSLTERSGKPYMDQASTNL